MTEQSMKLIPSKGTRLRVMIVVEFMSVVWAAISVFNPPELTDAITLTEYVDFQVAIFTAWAEFTIWNVGAYAASESFVKGGEAVMNRG